LEEQLLAALEQRLANPQMIEYVLSASRRNFRSALPICSGRVAGWKSGARSEYY
jgi:hypothetical protein